MRTVCLMLIAGGFALAAEPGNPAEFFESNIRPVLASKCYSCHTEAKSGGLQLDTREHALAGGNSGPAIKVGDPDGSLMMQALRRTHARLKMPPGPQLPDAQLDAIAKWIKEGAVWPAGVA